MKTDPMDHQLTGRALLAENPELYALAAEQGTGKTWMLLDDIERQLESGNITDALVIAPKGVHSNWIKRELPKHMSADVDAAYFLSNPKAAEKKALERFLKGDGRPGILSMNVDAVNTKKGYALAQEFLSSRRRTMMVVDESGRIRNPDAKRTKKIIELGKASDSRRIASGTMVNGSPLSVFSQFEFLAPGQGLLGTKSYRAFVAEFAELLPENHRLMQQIRRKTPFSPQVVARDPKGRPIYKNLDKLRSLMAPYTYRVLKKDCLDLPEKIYQTVDFSLTPVQRKIYEEVATNLRFERDDGDIDKFNALTKLTKLRQVTSGFIMSDMKPVSMTPPGENPRLKTLLDITEDVDGQFIVWAYYREEIAQIEAAFKDAQIPCVSYHGGIKEQAREDAVDNFQAGRARAFIGQPQAGGIGLTLTAAETAIYYSNDYNYENRVQSEDRCHRIGTTNHVTYIDLVAENTIDEAVAASIVRKGLVAFQILDEL